jgi:Xaa-Pro aminopeptidase
VLDANMSARNALKIGMLWKEYDKVARDYISLRGYGEYFGHGLGHSLGLEAHDPYNYAAQKFEDGMVVTDEPGIYVPDLGGVRIEDDLAIIDGTVQSLTPAPYLSL